MSTFYTMDCLIDNYFKHSKILLQKGETAEFISGDSNWSVKVEVNQLKPDKEILATVCRISTKIWCSCPKIRLVCYRFHRSVGRLELKDMIFQGLSQEWTTILVTEQFQMFKDEDIQNRENLRLMFELYLDPNATPEMFANFVTDIGGHLMNPTFSDVTIRTSEGDELPAHKILLVARSGVFRALFQHETAVKATNIVECPFPTNVVKHLLAFIYQDMVANIEETYSWELLVAADYYHLDRLKELCEDDLKKKLNVNNAIPLLLLADKLNACNLKKEALEFIIIKKNAVEIVKRKYWESLSKKLVQSIFKLTVSD